MVLDRNWIVGFTDGDGHFGCWISKDEKPAIRFNFAINQHVRDIKLLYALKKYFSCGRISKPYYTDQGKNGPYYRFEISNRKHLQEIIVPFFQENSLYTRKQHSFDLWCNLIRQVDAGYHLTLGGAHSIRQQKSCINQGNLPGISPTHLDPQWIVGFVDAEGMFAIGNEASNFTLTFSVSQSEIDKNLLRELQNYFKCGYLYKSRNTFVYRVTKLNTILDIIIPFFEKNKLHTSKIFDFVNFRKVALLKSKKLHLSQEGKDRICRIINKLH